MTRLGNMRTLVAASAVALSLSAGVASAQDCADTFAASGLGVTRLGPNRNPRLFVSGDFHTIPRPPDRRADEDIVRDLAYVSTATIEGKDRQLLTVLKSGGEGCFTPPAGRPVVPVGDDPRLIVAGPLDGDDAMDIAIVDAHVDQFNRSPRLRVLLGAGDGQFNPGAGVSVFALGEGEIPVAMVMGRFRGPKMPLDIAIASIPRNPGATSRGVVRLLFNNGKGEFDGTPSLISLGDVEPAAMVTSNAFRDGGKQDLVIKEAVTSSTSPRRILYLKNSGNGTFPDIASFDGAGSMPSLLLGVLESGDTAGEKPDVITFDEDMTLKIFVNDGIGALTRRVVNWKKREEFRFADEARQFVVADFGDRQLRLMAAAATTDDQQGILTLQSDKTGGFIDPPEFKRLRIAIETPPDTFVDVRTNRPVSSATVPPPPPALAIVGGIVSQFSSALHDDGRPDFGVIARHLVTELSGTPCAGAAQPVAPRPLTPSFASGPVKSSACTNVTPGNPLKCQDGLLFCTSPPVLGRCPCTCNPPPEPVPPPPPEAPLPACAITKEFLVLIVVGNKSDR